MENTLKYVIITGATSGIGEEITRYLHNIRIFCNFNWKKYKKAGKYETRIEK